LTTIIILWWYLTVFPSSPSAPCAPNFPSSLSSYRHSISLFLVLHDNVNVLHARRPCNLSPFQYTFAPFGPPCLTFIAAFFFFPFSFPTSFKPSSLIPSPSQSFAFILRLPTNKNVAPKANFSFFSHSSTQHATQASILCVDYLCIYSPGWYLSRTDKRRVSGVR
jgi:hypothetical protein